MSMAKAAEDAGRRCRLEHRIADGDRVGACRSPGRTTGSCSCMPGRCRSSPVTTWCWRSIPPRSSSPPLTGSRTGRSISDGPRIVPVVRQGHAGRALVDEAESQRGGDDRRRPRRQQPGVDDAGIDGQLRAAPHQAAGRGRARRRGGGGCRDRAPPRSVVVGVDDHELDPDHPGIHENPSVRAVRWAFDLPGVERVRVVHAWFLPSLAIGVHAEIAAETDEMDAAAEAADRPRARRCRVRRPTASKSSASRSGGPRLRTDRGVARGRSRRARFPRPRRILRAAARFDDRRGRRPQPLPSGRGPLT